MKKIMKVDLYESISRNIYKVIIHYNDGSREIVTEEKLNMTHNTI